jgi:hypothetical protein
MADPKDWYDDEVEGDAPEHVVEVEHEAHEEISAEVPVEIEVDDDGIEVIYGNIRVEPGVAKRGLGGKYINDEHGVRRKIIR